VELGALVVAAVARNGVTFFQYKMMWGGFPQNRVSGCQKFDSFWCFIFAEWRKENRQKEKRRKNIAVGKKGFSRAGPALLAVQQVTAVRCN
jgi:hypothetical protein